VLNLHRGLVNRLAWGQRVWGLKADDATLQQISISFDGLVRELFLPLLAGARVVMARPGAHLDPSALLERIASQQVTILNLVPSLLEDRCLRVLLEPHEPDPAAALETVSAIERLLGDYASDGTPRLLHGVDATAWPLLREAARRGYDARIGLEDTLRLPGGEPTGDNLDLVKAARAWISGGMIP
jgi:non-ribosomal peptide synthetase component F